MYNRMRYKDKMLPYILYHPVHKMYRKLIKRNSIFLPVCSIIFKHECWGVMTEQEEILIVCDVAISDSAAA